MIILPTLLMAEQYERDWYQQSFTRSLSHHWTGVQSLALEAVLTGRIERVGPWYAAKEAAEATTSRGHQARWPNSA